MLTLLSFLWSSFIGMIALVIGLVCYVLGAIGLYTMAKRRRINCAWFAWIPFLQGYILGKLDYDEVYGIPYAQWILLFGSTIITLLSAFTWGWVTWILDALLYMYTIGANNKLFNMYRPQNATLITIIGIFFPVLYQIWYFVIRNDR